MSSTSKQAPGQQAAFVVETLASGRQTCQVVGLKCGISGVVDASL
jgi:hypothetical protein